MKVSPVINCGDIECARKRFEAAAAIGAPTVHIDVSDGIFSPVVIGGTPEDLKKLLEEFPAVEAHVHLMVVNPEEVLESWLNAGAKRTIVHVEAVKAWPAVAALGGKYDAEIFLGMKKETSLQILESFTADPALKGVHLLAVPIGFSGGTQDPATPKRIKEIKTKWPRLLVSVDGGINLETARAVKAAGADEVVSATFIFNSPDPKRAYEDLIAL